MATNPEKPTLDVYSVAEIAQAARVPVSVVEALAADGRIRPVSPMHPFFDLDQAVAAVRLLHADRAQGGVFLFDQPTFEHTSAGLPVAVSSTFHAFVAGAIIFISTVGFPQASTQSEQPLEKIETRLVFLAQPGPGAGGGMGGGPYRPGSGITPPQILREVKADYTEDARRRSIEGEVVLEIVVRRDGSVGDVRLINGLPSGLNDRAIAAVKQWRFSPA